MWYSSKSRNEKADRPSKVENTASYPVKPEERIDGMHVRNISPQIGKISCLTIKLLLIPFYLF